MVNPHSTSVQAMLHISNQIATTLGFSTSSSTSSSLTSTHNNSSDSNGGNPTQPSIVQPQQHRPRRRPRSPSTSDSTSRQRHRYNSQNLIPINHSVKEVYTIPHSNTNLLYYTDEGERCNFLPLHIVGWS